MTVRDAVFDILPVAERDTLGEGPWWSVAEQTLTWVDILGRRVRRARLDGSDYREWTTPDHVGFVVPNEEGLLLLGLRDGLYWLDPATGTVTLDTRIDGHRMDHRINDGKTDHDGRVWFGSMHDAETEASSSFYRLDRSGVTEMLTGITTSNGLGWSPDGMVAYHTDSIARQMKSYQFDSEKGELHEGNVFAEDPPGYVPDGLTVDSEGFVWGAKWNGGKIVRYAPDGTIERELSLPVARPTSCMFVGSDLGTLAVTSAVGGANDRDGERLSGSTFLIDVHVRGLPERPAVISPAGPGGRPVLAQLTHPDSIQ